MAHGLLQDRFLVSAAIPISNKSTNPSTHVQCLPLKNVLHLLNHSRCDRYKYNAEKTIKTWIDLRSAISFICSVVQVNVLWLPSGICRSRNEWSTAQVANCCFIDGTAVTARNCSSQYAKTNRLDYKRSERSISDLLKKFVQWRPSVVREPHPVDCQRVITQLSHSGARSWGFETTMQQRTAVVANFDI